MDWQKNRVLIGVGTLAVLGGITYWAFTKNAGEQTTSETAEAEESLLPDLSKDAIDELEIHRPDTPVVRLVKRGTEWRLTEPVEAPADQSAIDTALDKLDELEMARIAATNAENHERLEVTGEKGIRVIVRSGGEVLADLYIGAYSAGNTMVRPEGEDRVAAVAGSIKFAFNKDVKDWRNRRVLDEAPADVVALELRSGESVYKFVRGEDDEWKQAEGETPIERFGASKVQSIVASLSRMRAVNFAEDAVTAETAGIGETSATATLTVRRGGAAEAEGEEEGEGEGETPPTPETTETFVLRLGGPSAEGATERYLAREGDPVIYVVSSYLAERIAVTLESFQTPEPGSEPEPAEAPPGMPPGMPPGGPGGSGEIPPEVMQQIQRQLQQQQAAGGH